MKKKTFTNFQYFYVIYLFILYVLRTWDAIFDIWALKSKKEALPSFHISIIAKHFEIIKVKMIPLLEIISFWDDCRAQK